MTSKKNYEKINIDGTCYKTQLTEKFKNRKNYERPDLTKLKSFIPGTIVDIFVKKGQEVNKGDDLLILEAMKMRNRIKAPMTGKIKSIKVKKSQVVPKEFLLVEFQ